tara:strand:- start:61 stop:840 length:780 start_codon:yes stop_codon:yes gene_type:complete
MGIFNSDELQVVFLDTPGVHEARGLLNRRMVDQALSTLSDVDLVMLMIDPRSEADPEQDSVLLERIRSKGLPLILVINKVDLVEKPRLLPVIQAWDEAVSPLAIVPLSALKQQGLDPLMAVIAGQLSEGPAYFPKDQLSDVSERFVVSELIREKLFIQLDKELPYSLAVEIEEWEEARKKGDVTRIMARIWVERDSQKAIVIGRKGARIKEVGTAARLDVERLLGTRVFLKLTVGVKKDWTRKKSVVEGLGHFDTKGHS